MVCQESTEPKSLINVACVDDRGAGMRRVRLAWLSVGLCFAVFCCVLSVHDTMGAVH